MCQHKLCSLEVEMSRQPEIGQVSVTLVAVSEIGLLNQIGFASHLIQNEHLHIL